MKICFYDINTGVRHGGVETYNYNLSYLLNKLGHEVIFITGKGNKNIKVKTKRFFYIPRKYIKFHSKLFERLSFGLFTLFYFLNKQFDVIIISKIEDIYFASLISLITKSKILFIIHGFQPISFITKLFLKRVTIFVTICKYLKDKIIKNYNIPENKVKLLYTGIPINSLLTLKDIKHNKNNNITILSLCRLVPWKGVDILIKAFYQVREKLKTRELKNKLKLIIGGSGPIKKELEKLALNLGISDYIEFSGYINSEELVDYYSKADIFVLPSKRNYEGFPIVLLEAMASKTPVIATNSGGVPELIKHKINGLLSKMDDINSLADNILLLVNNKNLRIKLAENGYYSVQEYNITNYLKKFNYILMVIGQS
ncbi:MAG: glycosyltransferase family 4 protein [Candidatus Helarchaeota archaeon]